MEKYLSHAMFMDRDIKRFDDHGMSEDTPLHLAAMNDEAEDVEFMLSEVESVDVPGDIGSTPLHMAVMFGSAAVVDVLLRLGAKIDAENEYGSKPLDFLGRNSEEVMSVVRKYHPEL
jgi:ankyrin repeat protein